MKISATPARLAFIGIAAAALSAASAEAVSKEARAATVRVDALAEDKVTVPDFNATISYALGLPLDNVIDSPSKQAFTTADKGRPVTRLFGHAPLNMPEFATTG